MRNAETKLAKANNLGGGWLITLKDGWLSYENFITNLNCKMWRRLFPTLRSTPSVPPASASPGENLAEIRARDKRKEKKRPG